jgi:spermidine synthase
MHLLARFKAPNGVILVKECKRTGARHYEEGGVSQSCVLAGGEAGIAYVCLMASLLERGSRALLLGCGGGSLATMLHRRGARVWVVDVNPISFQLARTFFWMPKGIQCITADMRPFIRRQTDTFDAIGIDVGGPRFSYEEVLDTASIAGVRRALSNGGRIAVNISCECRSDPVAGRIAERLKAKGLDVWVFMEKAPDGDEVNAIILASARKEKPAALEALCGETWTLAHLSG